MCSDECHFQNRSPEENKAQPESATTVCSAAGGDVEQDKTGRSADWQACFNEVIQLAEKEIAFRKAGMDDEPGGFTAGCWTQAVCFKRAIERVAEERRRSEERT